MSLKVNLEAMVYCSSEIQIGTLCQHSGVLLLMELEADAKTVLCLPRKFKVPK